MRQDRYVQLMMTIYAYSTEQRRGAKETQRRYKMTTHRTLKKKKKKMTTQIVLLCDNCITYCDDKILSTNTVEITEKNRILII